MIKTRTILIITVVIIIIIFTGVTLTKESPESSLRETMIEELEEKPEETLSVKHQYKDGEHVFVGTIDLPTPCHSYNSEIIAEEAEGGENMPEIKITISEPNADIICAQVIAEHDFKVTYKSDDPDLKFKATINGILVNLNIFEVSPQDNIDTIELFLKG